MVEDILSKIEITKCYGILPNVDLGVKMSFLMKMCHIGPSEHHTLSVITTYSSELSLMENKPGKALAS